MFLSDSFTCFGVKTSGEKTDIGFHIVPDPCVFMIVLVKSHGQLKYTKDGRIFEQKLVILNIIQ